MANPIAVPGTVVSSGAAVSPGGAQGPTVVSANANNKATLGTDSLLLVQGTAAGVAATTHAQTVSGDDPQLTNARTPTAHEASHVTGSDQIPLASASTKGLLNQTSGNTTDFVDGTNNSQPLQPVIWSATRRVINAIGNPTFEVDQRNVGNAITVTTGGVTAAVDRWFVQQAGTMTATSRQMSPSTFVWIVPGTNYVISTKMLRLALGTAQATLGATDQLSIYSLLEGPVARELINDVTSLSLFVKSSVAPLTFGVAIRDSNNSVSLVKLCTIPTANTATLIQLPNLPVFPASGNFPLAPGGVGYQIKIGLAVGSSFITPANDTWQTGNFFGAVGQNNFAATAGAIFDIGFIQHEPGALCTTPIDCPFGENYDGAMGCLRYYTKSYLYSVWPGAVNDQRGAHMGLNSANQPPYYWYIPFKKTMAKVPTVTAYSPTTGAINNIRNLTAGADIATTGAAGVGDSAFEGFAIASPPASLWGHQFHYTADTGW